MPRARTAVLALILLASLAACVTPPVVKQAVVDLDGGYAENLKMMQQYRQLVAKVNERQRYWYLYVRQRLLLDLALRSITQDHWAGDGQRVDVTATFLGDDLRGVVNDLRLEGLAAQRGSAGSVQFAAGKPSNSPTRIVERLPEIVNRVTAKAQQDYRQVVTGDTSHFTAYLTNVAALQQVNAAVKRYLDIDVTIAPKDVAEIATAIRQLQE